MLCSSGYIEHDRLNLVVLGHFLSFYLPKNLKNQIFENMKKIAGDIFLSCIPKITIKWCGGPGMRSHFAPFFALSPLNNLENQTSEKMKKHLKMSSLYIHVYQKSWYDVCFLRYGMPQAEFFCHFGPFFALYSLKKWQNQNFKKKWKKHLEIWW